MTCLVELLQAAGSELEGRLRPQLAGFAGGIIAQYLPQSWVFRTETESVTLTVERNGTIRAVAGATPNPDVTIETTHDRLSVALRTRGRAPLPPGPFHAVSHTPKGATAYGLLRQRLGL